MTEQLIGPAAGRDLRHRGIFWGSWCLKTPNLAPHGIQLDHRFSCQVFKGGQIDDIINGEFINTKQI